VKLAIPISARSTASPSSISQGRGSFATTSSHAEASVPTARIAGASSTKQAATSGSKA
jgi:hypothetical protein